MIRPKLFGYGALPMLLVVPCILFTACSIPRLQRMMEVHRLIWNDMANAVRFDQHPKAPKDVQLRKLLIRDDEASSGRRPDDYLAVNSSSQTNATSSQHADLGTSCHSSVDSGAELLPVPPMPATNGDVSNYGSAPSKLS